MQFLEATSLSRGWLFHVKMHSHVNSKVAYHTLQLLRYVFEVLLIIGQVCFPGVYIPLAFKSMEEKRIQLAVMVAAVLFWGWGEREGFLNSVPLE